MRIQDTVACPKCGYGQASHEYETLDGSERLICQRCAYIKRVTPEVDWDVSQSTGQRVRELAEAGRFGEVAELIGRGMEHEGLARAEVERGLSNGLIVLKRNHIGQFVYRIEESGGYGSWLIRDPDSGQIEVGQLPADPAERAREIARLNALEELGRVVRVFPWEPDQIVEGQAEALAVLAEETAATGGMGKRLDCGC